MPCDSIQRSKVQFLATSTDTKLLAKGLRAHGYSVRETTRGLEIVKDYESGNYDSATGRLTIPRGWDSNEFKRAYSEQVVIQTASEHGWDIGEWTYNEAGNRETTVEKGA